MPIPRDVYGCAGPFHNGDKICPGCGRVPLETYAFRGLGRFDEALAALDEALAVEPRNRLALEAKGRLLVDLGRTAEAMDVLPGSPLAGVELALLIYRSGSGRIDDATEHLLAAARSQPRDADEYVAKGIALRAMGYWVESLNCFESALSLEPAHYVALPQRAAVASRLGWPAAAVESYRKSLSTHGERESVRRDLEAVEALLAGDGVVERDPAAALVEYERACAIDPAHPAFGYARLSALDALERYGMVLTVADPLIAELSGPSSSHVNWRIRIEFLKLRALAAVLLRQDARDLARSMVEKMSPCPERDQLEKFLQGESAESPARGELAWMWHHEANRRMREGRLEDTEDGFRRAIYIDRDEPAHLGGLAGCLLMLAGRKPGALEESLASFERVITLRPNDPVILFNYASTLTTAGRHADALGIAQCVLELTPDDPDLHDLIRRIRERGA